MTDFPGITKYARETAFDNGGINAARSEKQMRRELRVFLGKVAGDYDLGEIDRWLSALSENDLHEVVSGDQEEQRRILESAPPFAEKFMCQYFDERSEEHTSQLQSLMRISYAVFCLKKKKNSKYRD